MGALRFWERRVSELSKTPPHGANPTSPEMRLGTRAEGPGKLVWVENGMKHLADFPIRALHGDPNVVGLGVCDVACELVHDVAVGVARVLSRGPSKCDGRDSIIIQAICLSTFTDFLEQRP